MSIGRFSIAAAGVFALCLLMFGCAARSPVRGEQEVVVLWSAEAPSPLAGCQPVALMGSAPGTRWAARTVRELRHRAAARGANALHVFWRKEQLTSDRAVDVPVGWLDLASAARDLIGAAFRCDSSAVLAELRAHPARLAPE
jgi:hypothetical protein